MTAISGEKTVTVDKFTGLNIEDDPGLIGDRELVECVNFLLGPAGNLFKRPGINRLGSFIFPATPVRILGQFLTGSFNHVIAATPTQLYYSTDNGVTWILMGAAANAVSCAQYLDKLYIVTLAAGIKKWTGTVLSDIASSPNGAQIIAFKDRLWVVGTGTANYSRFYFSDPGAASETWGASSFLDIAAGDGDKLVAAAPYQDHWVLFKTRSVHNLYLSGDILLWQRKLSSSAHGATSPTGVVEVDGLLYFLYNKGVYRTDGILFREVTPKIRSAFANTPLVPLTFLDTDSLSLIGRRLICTFDSFNGIRTFVYHLDAGGWTELRVSQAMSLTPGRIFSAVATDGVYKYLISQNEASNGRMYELASFNGPEAVGATVYQDDGNNFDSWFMTKFYHFGEFSRLKRGKWSVFEADGTQAKPSIGYHVDQSEMNTVVNPSDVIVDSQAAYRIPGPGYFRECAFHIQENTDQAFNFLGLTMYLHVKKPVMADET